MDFVHFSVHAIVLCHESAGKVPRENLGCNQGRVVDNQTSDLADAGPQVRPVTKSGLGPKIRSLMADFIKKLMRVTPSIPVVTVKLIQERNPRRKPL